MPRDFRTRLGLYATLAVAALCLAAAEQPFFPWAFAWAVPLLALMGLGLLVEGRWVLPIWAANVLGVAIAGAWGVWIDLRVFGDNELGFETIPLPAALLPNVGPLLAVLVLALLFRPKQPRDYWLLQGLGLLEVALGCVLASGPLFGGLLCAYLAVGLWSLALFQLAREPGEPRPGAARPRTGALRWLPAVLGLALALFLVLPRSDGQPWDAMRLAGPGARPRSVAAETGAAEEMDLNRTGWLQVNEEVAFRVQAEDASHRPKTDLDPYQHWRGRFVDIYDQGRWTASYDSSLAFQASLPPTGGPGVMPGLARVEQRLCDLGPRQFFLNFEVDAHRAGGLFLADPVAFRSPDGRTTNSCWVAAAGPPLLSPLFVESQGTLVSGPYHSAGTLRYRQVTVPPPEGGLSLPLPALAFSRGYALRLCRQPAPGLTDWTRERVRRLASVPGGPLSPADLVYVPAPADLRPDHPGGVLPPEKWEKVGRAVCAYLAHSGDYAYTLERRRKDLALDPTLDFLANVKEGHCERYAGGLALMLRALGIPSRVVLGFRGADSVDDGVYEVHQSQAHAWVECLVLRGAPGDDPQFYWLELDPTPAGEAAAPPLFDLGVWREGFVAAGKEFWQHFILDYTSEQQEGIWSRAAEALGRVTAVGLRPGWALGLAGAVLASLLAVVWLVRRAPRRRPAPAAGPAAPFYRRLLAILARRRRLRPRPTQTPREFAEAVRSLLAGNPATAALAGLPRGVADLLYRVRFGARPLTAEEAQAVGHDLDRLDAALAGR